MEIRQAVDDDIGKIKQVAQRYAKQIGFILRPALVEAIKRGTLLFHEDSGSFCHYRIRQKDSVVVIYEICVPVEFRKNGIAKAMVDFLPRPIQLKCPVDNESNNFYEHMGFTLIAVEKGKKRKLNVWRLE